MVLKLVTVLLLYPRLYILMIQNKIFLEHCDLFVTLIHYLVHED